MTMPHERTRAVTRTREFLFELAHGKRALPKEIRSTARMLLRHYPMSSDMQIAHLYAPQWFGPPEQ